MFTNFLAILNFYVDLSSVWFELQDQILEHVYKTCVWQTCALECYFLHSGTPSAITIHVIKAKAAVFCFTLTQGLVRIRSWQKQTKKHHTEHRRMYFSGTLNTRGGACKVRATRCICCENEIDGRVHVAQAENGLVNMVCCMLWRHQATKRASDAQEPAQV